MRKLIFITLILILFAVIYNDVRKPDFVKINEQEVEQCTRAMAQDENFICD